jgi:hypothetical protein
MDERPVLICYDGSLSARHAIGAAADLLAPHRAVVLDVASPLTVAESAAALGPMMPDFARPNSEEALARARAGAELAHAAGFHSRGADHRRRSDMAGNRPGGG